MKAWCTGWPRRSAEAGHRASSVTNCFDEQADAGSDAPENLTRSNIIDVLGRLGHEVGELDGTVAGHHRVDDELERAPWFSTRPRKRESSWAYICSVAFRTGPASGRCGRRHGMDVERAVVGSPQVLLPDQEGLVLDGHAQARSLIKRRCFLALTGVVGPSTRLPK